ncbi:MAG: hypothetical protein AB4368_07600 [Xenococcaceae cyanobacterium]
MRNLQGLSETVIFLLLFGSASVVGSIGILADRHNDINNCQLSANNQGCSLNRPVDIATTDKSTSFQFVYDRSTDSMRLIKVQY